MTTVVGAAIGYGAGVVDVRWVHLRVAWGEALYGAEGFYRRNQPADHFRTSAQASHRFAGAVVALARRHGITSVCDIGAGGGELVAEIHRQEPTWKLVAVEVRDRPYDLPGAIGWQRELPAGHEGLVIANELLDNVPCDVVERAEDGSYLLVEVDAATGDQRPGSEAAPDQRAWLSTWWPLTETGERAEVGLTRDALWAEVCTANPRALCIAVDYGHVAVDRPSGGSLSSYRGGVQTAVTYDGQHDITAHVAFDSLASRVGGKVRRQREVLQSLGVDGGRPPLSKAIDDPAGYLADLALAAEAGDLISSSGLGAFLWIFRLPTEGAVGLG